VLVEKNLVMMLRNDNQGKVHNHSHMHGVLPKFGDVLE
jgi:hypothetical protein